LQGVPDFAEIEIAAGAEPYLTGVEPLLIGLVDGRMTCALCDCIDPGGAAPGWSKIEVDHALYFVCPAEFPPGSPPAPMEVRAGSKMYRALANRIRRRHAVHHDQAAKHLDVSNG